MIHNLFQIPTVVFNFIVKLSMSVFKQETVVLDIQSCFGIPLKANDFWIMIRKAFGKTFRFFSIKSSCKNVLVIFCYHWLKIFKFY